MIKWSYSGLKTFINCPKQYHEVKILKNYIQPETEQIKYGKEVHSALEHYVRDSIPLPTNYQRFQSLLDVLLEIPGRKYVEHQMALTQDKQPCGFDAPEYWVRGIADLLIVDGDTAFVLDYKTGSNKYADPKQLKLMALMVFQHFPQVQRVKGGLIFVVKNSFLPDTYTRDQVHKYWIDFDPDLMRLALAEKYNNWHPNPTPLCGWCPVKSCSFHKGE